MQVTTLKRGPDAKQKASKMPPPAGDRKRTRMLTRLRIMSGYSAGSRHGHRRYFGALFLLLFPMLYGQERQMHFSQNRTLVLTSYALTFPVLGASDAPAFKVVIQEDPFIEIQLQNPLPESRLIGRRLRFFCEQVGVFKDQRSQNTWTIGKGCKPLQEPQQNGR